MLCLKSNNYKRVLGRGVAMALRRWVPHDDSLFGAVRSALL